jgi:hypothetical protein
MVDLEELQRLRDAAILHEAMGMAENDMWAKELREEIALMVPAIIAELKAGRKLAEAVRQVPNAGYWRAIPSELAEFDDAVKQ